MAAWIHTCHFLKLFGYKARQSTGIEKVPKHATAPWPTRCQSPVLFTQSGWCIDTPWTPTGYVACFNDHDELQLNRSIYTSRLHCIDYLIQNSDKTYRAWGLSINPWMILWYSCPVYPFECGHQDLDCVDLFAGKESVKLGFCRGPMSGGWNQKMCHIKIPLSRFKYFNLRWYGHAWAGTSANLYLA